MDKLKAGTCFSALIAFCFLLFPGCGKIDSVVGEKGFQNGGEYWESFSTNGRQIGFQKTTISNAEIEGKSVRRFEIQSRLTVLRFGDRFDVAMKLAATTDPDGTFLSGTTQLLSGNTTGPMETQYDVDGETLQISGPQGRSSIPWKSGTLGPDALLRNLADKPMEIGEAREIEFFDPALAQIVRSSFRAERIETVPVDGRRYKLVRIDVSNVLGSEASQQTFSNTLWTDRGGNVVRSRISMDGRQTIFADRTTKENALRSVSTDPVVELGQLGFIPLNRPISNPDKAPVLSFLVQMEQGSPTNRFPNTPFQSVVPLDPKTAKITVWSAVGLDSRTVGNPAFIRSHTVPQPGDLSPNPWIRPDDPELLKLAATVDSNGRTPWEIALALEKLVHDFVQPNTFSIAFASSSEVLQARCGDCTEYAVLLGALCRAKRIPTRLTLGLVNAPLPNTAGKEGEEHSAGKAESGMAFHLWNEVLVEGVWRPLDATLGLGGATAARIKIGDTNLAEGSPAPLVQSILGVIGQIRLNVVPVSDGSSTTPGKGPAK